MSGSSTVNRKTFLFNLRQSKLLTESQLAVALRDVPKCDRGDSLARALVEKECLTRFQAERLLAGRNTGFLLGQYRILDRLGRGGMGRVFKAEHCTMMRVVALKLLAPHLLQSERARTLFLREVQAIAQLVHPNVVAAFDAGKQDGHYFLVLEYVDGPNLDRLVRKQGPLPFGLACDYIKQAANGLQAAHALGMVHRDIKPANLLIQRRGLHDHSPGLLKISDFGLARLGGTSAAPVGEVDTAGTILTKQNTVMGTPDFLSPEQARDLHRADIRSDLYSLGCTFYFLLTGQPPFPGGTALEKLIRHSVEQPAPVQNFRDDVPVTVRAIVERLLAKSADHRFQTPRALAEVLEPFAVSGPTPWASSPPPSNPELDAASTPLNDAPSSSPNVLEGSSSEDWAELTGTSPPDLSPTTLNVPISSRAGVRQRGGRREIKIWMWLALLTLLAGLALLMALL